MFNARKTAKNYRYSSPMKSKPMVSKTGFLRIEALKMSLHITFLYRHN